MRKEHYIDTLSKEELNRLNKSFEAIRKTGLTINEASKALIDSNVD